MCEKTTILVSWATENQLKKMGSWVSKWAVWLPKQVQTGIICAIQCVKTVNKPTTSKRHSQFSPWIATSGHWKHHETSKKHGHFPQTRLTSLVSLTSSSPQANWRIFGSFFNIRTFKLLGGWRAEDQANRAWKIGGCQIWGWDGHVSGCY